MHLSYLHLISDPRREHTKMYPWDRDRRPASLRWLVLVGCTLQHAENGAVYVGARWQQPGARARWSEALHGNGGKNGRWRTEEWRVLRSDSQCEVSMPTLKWLWRRNCFKNYFSMHKIMIFGNHCFYNAHKMLFVGLIQGSSNVSAMILTTSLALKTGGHKVSLSFILPLTQDKLLIKQKIHFVRVGTYIFL